MVFDLLESLAPDDAIPAGDDEAIPPLILESRILTDLHRRELTFLVALEEGTLKVASRLIRGAAAGESLYFAARQTFDDARHLEAFCRRLDATLAAGRSEPEPPPVVARPLRAYFDRCLAVAEPSTHLEALTLLNLGFKSMAGAFYAFAARYWQGVDPLLSQWLGEVAGEEAVHVRRAAQLVRGAEEMRQSQLLHVATEATESLHDAFRAPIGGLVSGFGVAARQHRDHFGDAEFAYGRLLLRVSEDEQIAFIHARCAEALAGTLAQAGLQPRPR